MTLKNHLGQEVRCTVVKHLSNLIQELHSLPRTLKPSIYACIYLLVDFLRLYIPDYSTRLLSPPNDLFVCKAELEFIRKMVCLFLVVVVRFLFYFKQGFSV